jgi:hypothetical protein
MGLLFSDSSSGPSHKVFKTSKEIRETLYQIHGLTEAERHLIFEVMVKQLDDGGVTSFEGMRKVDPVLYQMVKQGKISDFAYKSVKKLWQ